MTPSTKRVVITGMGVISPLGLTPESVWEALRDGRSGISPIKSLPMDDLPFRSGAEATEFTGAIEDYGDLDKSLQRAIKKNMKVMCREIEMGVAAAQRALQHSGLGEDRDPERCGCLFGADYILTRPEEYADGIRACRAASGKVDILDWPKHGLSKVNPLWLLKYLPNMPNSHVSIYNDFRATNNSLTVREASMNLAVAEASSIIRRGTADVMLVGATGSRIHPLRTTHIYLTDQVASEQADPTTMSRPFDVSRDGMAVGEGAGALMLESWEHADRRGAKIWGEVIGQGAAMVGPNTNENRDYLRLAVGRALRAAETSSLGRLPSAWHLHAHGLSSTKADASEALAISDVLMSRQIPVTAAKSYFGNLGAGASAVELISSVLAMHAGTLFPIRNLKNPCAEATFPALQDFGSPGEAFLHCSFTPQGQAAALAIAKAA
ncbi:MAG: beta-ketoacyl-[acyl-carrier-protein] synthase family protein [Planctomycetales bacterium]|nr:beta-ketoacyl-[acyl-carrier-protein] synthase family protein [Planctomycetales bacterium]